MATEAQIPIVSDIPQGSPGASSSSSYRLQPWYVAYMDALFEADRTRIGERIKRAERLIVFRERELFNSRTGHAEQRALGNALHALRALRSCFEIDKGVAVR